MIWITVRMEFCTFPLFSDGFPAQKYGKRVLEFSPVKRTNRCVNLERSTLVF